MLDKYMGMAQEFIEESDEEFVLNEDEQDRFMKSVVDNQNAKPADSFGSMAFQTKNSHNFQKSHNFQNVSARSRTPIKTVKNYLSRNIYI